MLKYFRKQNEDGINFLEKKENKLLYKRLELEYVFLGVQLINSKSGNGVWGSYLGNLLKNRI